ncbi:MAG: ATP-binding cassette domain-containing protein, partial [Oscillospiraceae bacterium]
MDKPILEIRGLGKYFSVVRALDNITMDIKKGEIHAICGENGAGKSTLMKILDGFYPYGTYEGDFYVDGQKCCFHSPKDSTAAGIAMIYQEISILEYMNLADNILAGNYPIKNGIIDKKETHRIAEKYLAMVNLDKSSF